jgi:hypothetical protein
LGIAGKEYQWDDAVALAPFPAGLRPSQDYSATALLLEYSLALTETAIPKEAPEGLSGPQILEVLRTRLDDYFSLSSDDHARLSVLSTVLLSQDGEPETGARRTPDNIGECLRFWLQREQRLIVRDFLARFLTLPRPAENEGIGPEDLGWQGESEKLIRAICASLDVGREGLSELPALSLEASLEFGSRVSAALAPLFKD